MRHTHLQFVAMSIFVTGFVLAGSGWSLVLAGKMQHKAAWSVCGQDMCSCLPSADDIEPYCPLCLLDDSTESSCSDTQPIPTDTPRRVPNTKRFEAASAASQAGCASIFLSFIFGSPAETKQLRQASSAYIINNDDVPSAPADDPTTPPPRA